MSKIQQFLVRVLKIDATPSEEVKSRLPLPLQETDNPIL